MLENNKKANMMANNKLSDFQQKFPIPLIKMMEFNFSFKNGPKRLMKTHYMN